MSRRLMMCLLACAMVATVSMAKDDEPKEKTRRSSMSGGWGFFGPYWAMFSFDNLNTQLQSDTTLGFTDSYNKNQFMFGGGGMAISDNVSIGGYGFGG